MIDLQSYFPKRARYQELLDDAMYRSCDLHDQQIWKEKIKEVNEDIKKAKGKNEAKAQDQAQNQVQIKQAGG